MRKILKGLKMILEIIILLIVTICTFGGGCLIWTIIAIFIQPSPQVAEIMFYVSALVPIPFCWYIAPKISNKIL